jgi:hypothetical protein
VAFSASGDGVTELPEQIGRRITPPPFGTRLLFPQLGTLLSEMLDRKIDLAKKKPAIVGTLKNMGALKSLTFTTIPKIGANPTFDRRGKIIALLEEQKLLVKDSKYTRTVRTWVKKDGQLTPVEKQQRVLPWWRVNADGSYVFFVRSGSKAIEFEKGKNAVAVPSFDKVPLVIDILIAAVRNGELDDQLAQAKKPPRAMTSRKAA